MANIIIVGCGRVGSDLAQRLAKTDHNVCVIDTKAEAFNNLGRDFNGNTQQGMGFDEDVLIRAGIHECDFLAAVTSNDNTNLMTVEVAKRIFNVPQVITRLYNNKRESAYMQLGLDYVCGTSLVAEEIFSVIMSGSTGHLDTFGDYEVLRFSIDLSWTKTKSIKVSDLEKNHGVRVACFERADGSSSSVPSGGSTLYHGDTVVAAVHHDLLKRFSKFIIK